MYKFEQRSGESVSEVGFIVSASKAPLLCNEYDEGTKAFSIEDHNITRVVKNEEMLVFAYPMQYSTVPKMLRDFIIENNERWESKKIFDKTVNSSFKGMGLLEYLMEKNIHTVAVVGLQTDYCIDATIKCGFEHGFKMIVPENANSTFDNAFMTGEQSYKYYNDFMWKGRFDAYLDYSYVEAREKFAECISIHGITRSDVDLYIRKYPMSTFEYYYELELDHVLA